MPSKLSLSSRAQVVLNIDLLVDRVCWSPTVYIKDTHYRLRDEKVFRIYREWQMWPHNDTVRYWVKIVVAAGQRTTSFEGTRQIHPNSFFFPVHFWLWNMLLTGQYNYLNASKVSQMFPRVKYRQELRISGHLCFSSMLNKFVGPSQGQGTFSKQYLSLGDDNSEKSQWYQETHFQVWIL